MIPIVRTLQWLPPGFQTPYMLTGFWFVEEVDLSGMPVKCSITKANGSIELVFSGEWRITNGPDDPELVARWTEWMIVWWG